MQKKHESLEKEIKGLIAESCGPIAIATDGWSNIRNEHLVNFVLVLPNHSPILFKTIDTSGTSQTGEEIFRKIKEVILEIGAEKINAVVTDNAANMRKAWKLIEAEYPHIFANGCAAHMLNLLVKDIIDDEYEVQYAETLSEAVQISKFIKTRGPLSQKFRSLQTISKDSTRRFLSLPVDTRWYTQYNCISNVLHNRSILAQLAADRELMEKYRDENGLKFKSLIDSDDFWDRCKNLSDILKPISEAILSSLLLRS